MEISVSNNKLPFSLQKLIGTYVVGPYELISKIFNFQENPEEKQEVDSFVNSLKSSMRNKMFSMLLEEAEKEAEDEPVLRSNYRYVVLCRY